MGIAANSIPVYFAAFLCAATFAGCCPSVQKPFEASPRHAPRPVMGREYWTYLSSWRYSDPGVGEASGGWNAEIADLPVFRDCGVVRSTGKGAPDPAGTKATWRTVEENCAPPQWECLERAAKKDRPLVLVFRGKRDQGALAGEVDLDYDDWSAFKAANTNLVCCRTICEWGNDILMFIKRTDKVTNPARNRELRERWSQYDMANRDDRLSLSKWFVDRMLEVHYGDRDMFMAFRHCLSLDHVAAAWGAKMLTLETTNTTRGDSEYRWDVAGMFVRGAARQFGLPWCWYEANYFNGPGKDGTWLSNSVCKEMRKVGNGYNIMPEGGTSASAQRRVWYYAYLNGANGVESESWTSQFVATDARSGKDRLTKRGRSFSDFHDFAAAHPGRGVAYAPVAILTPFAQGYPAYGGPAWNRCQYTPGDYAIDALFFTIAPGWEREKGLRAGIQEGNLHNSRFAMMYDVLVPDSPQQKEEFAKALFAYPAAILVGDYPDLSKFEDVLAAYVRAGGRLVRLSADGLPPLADGTVGDIKAGRLKFPTVERMLEGLQRDLFPFAVEGDCQYGANRTKDGWWLWVFNNKGVRKFADTFETIDRSRDSEISVRFTHAAPAPVKELVSGKSVHVSDGRFAFTVPAGDFAIFEIGGVDSRATGRPAEPDAACARGLEGYSIVRPPVLSESDAFVLKDVNGLLARSLGEELPVCLQGDAPAAKRLFFGIPPKGFDVAELESQEKVVVVKDGDVHLFGGGTNGMRYAAYDFLQNTLGYRFFDARGGMYVPDLRKVALRDGTRRRKFAFEERECRCWTRYAGREAALFFFRHGQNGGIAAMMERDGAGAAVDDYQMPRPNSHTLTRLYLPRESIESHPEYFSLYEGKRAFHGQRCLSNPDVRRMLKEAVFKRLESVKEPAFIDLSAGDTPGRFCECDGCAALERKYGATCGPLVDVFMELCPEAYRLYPRHRLMTLAYRKNQTQRPPKGVERMPDNFVARFAPINDDFSKDWGSPDNADTLADLKRWCRMCGKVLMWYYPNPYGKPLTPPIGNIERLVNDIRAMRSAGVAGATFQHDVGADSMTGFSELQTYVMMRLFDDVSLDWRALVDEFVKFEYGAAADEVGKYLAELEVLRKGTKTFFPWNAGLQHCDYLTDERLARWGEAFDRMERMAAGDRTRLRNLHRLRINLDYATLGIAKKVALASRIKDTVGEIVADCYDRRHARMADRFKKEMEEWLFLSEIQCGGGRRPLPADLFGGVPQSRIFVTLPHSYAGGMRDDPDAAYGKAAVYDGGDRPETMGLPFVAGFATRLPRQGDVAKIGRGVDAGNIAPPGEYRFYDMGRVTLTRDCFVKLNSHSLRAPLNAAYVEGEFNNARIYASLKFQGPAFYPSETSGQSLAWCDIIVVVREE